MPAHARERNSPTPNARRRRLVSSASDAALRDFFWLERGRTHHLLRDRLPSAGDTCRPPPNRSLPIAAKASRAELVAESSRSESELVLSRFRGELEAWHPVRPLGPALLVGLAWREGQSSSSAPRIFLSQVRACARADALTTLILQIASTEHLPAALTDSASRAPSRPSRDFAPPPSPAAPLALPPHRPPGSTPAPRAV